MGIPYAEVIGDPVDHSKSPLIHKFWLEKLGRSGDFRTLRLEPHGLPRYLSSRCADPFWRGCSVTAPLKQHVARLVADPTGLCRRVGACNAVFRSPFGCGIGANTDLLGIAAALEGQEPPPQRVCVVGTGGAARAVLEYLRARGVGDIAVVARNPAKARRLWPQARAYGFGEAADALAGTDCAVNATPLGMTGQPPLPDALLDALERTVEGATVCDLVYAPLETPWLERARALGRHPIDGLEVLIGQAAPAFELFFGTPAPREHDEALRERLAR